MTRYYFCVILLGVLSIPSADAATLKNEADVFTCILPQFRVEATLYAVTQVTGSGDPEITSLSVAGELRRHFNSNDCAFFNGAVVGSCQKTKTENIHGIVSCSDVVLGSCGAVWKGKAIGFAVQRRRILILHRRRVHRKQPLHFPPASW